VPLIEDAACAIGSEILWDGEWQRIGRPHGDIACFSFHPRKLLSTGDGGMITTRHPAIDSQCRLLRQHGMNVSDTARHAAQQVVFEHYDVLGFNHRMTDIHAAVGREQLKRLAALVDQRRLRAARYARGLAHLGVAVQREPEWARTNWQSYAVRLPEGADQRSVMQRMLDEGVATRRGVTTIHRERAYPPGTWRGDASALRNGERLQESTVLLPLYHQMTDQDQDRVIEAFARAARP
jgi:dTDP-4-amino-4,6-dideoxygalactose transaminase